MSKVIRPLYFIKNGSGGVEDVSRDWCKKVIMQLENETKVDINNLSINHDQVTTALLLS
jgi:hypothetical protein